MNFCLRVNKNLLFSRSNKLSANSITAYVQGIPVQLWSTPEAAGMVRDSQVAKNRVFEGHDDIHVAKP